MIIAAKDAQGMTNDQKDVVKGLTICIKQLHLRYEDDYYSSECPYSFGLVIDVSTFIVTIYATSLKNINSFSLCVFIGIEIRNVREPPLIRKVERFSTTLTWTWLDEHCSFESALQRLKLKGGSPVLELYEWDVHPNELVGVNTPHEIPNLWSDGRLVTQWDDGPSVHTKRPISILIHPLRYLNQLLAALLWP